MQISLIVLVFLILLIGFVLKLLASGRDSGGQDMGDPVKFDFMLFNSDGLKCKDGQVVNVNIIVEGLSHEKVLRELIHEEYAKSLQKMALAKESDWFFSERALCEQLFVEEFKKLYSTITLGSLEIKELSYADACFTDRDIADKYLNKEREQVKKEVEKREADFERERDELERKLKEERDLAIKNAEEEAAVAMARLEEENKRYIAEAEKAYQEAVKQEEELKKKK